MKITEKMDRGVKALDDYYGENWVHRINTRRLNIVSTTNCVLGQLAGPGRTYIHAANRMGIGRISEYGFALPHLPEPDNALLFMLLFPIYLLDGLVLVLFRYPVITLMWRHKIRKLQQERSMAGRLKLLSEKRLLRQGDYTLAGLL